MEMREVYSSHVDSIGYDPEKHELIVRWAKGKVSAYEGVTPDHAEQIMNAPSIGQALNESIKGAFKHRYL